MLDVIWDPTSCHVDKAILGEEMASYQRSMLGSGHGFWEWDLITNKMFWYGIFWRELGYSELDTRSMTAPEVLLHYIHPDDREGFRVAIADTIKEAAPLDYCYRLQGKQGGYLWVRVTGQGYRDKNGWTHHIAGANYNISELKKTQSALVDAKVAAEKANHAKSDFLSSMSHELRTPLNAILGFTQLVVRDGRTCEEHRENLSEVESAGKHLLGLINEILDLAKIEAGRLALSLETLAPCAVLTECIRLVAPLAEQYQVTVHGHWDDTDTWLICADYTRLKQVVLNLLSNAIKYNRPGGRVEVALQHLANGQTRIRVSDTGLGIPKAALGDVFEPFTRLHSPHSSAEGSGVGLVITKRLVEMMSGELDFTSVEGEGSCFWADLPQASRLLEPRASLNSRELLDGAETLEIEGKRQILYVEDNPANAQLLHKMLDRFEPLELDVTTEPMVGIYRARTQKPDLIILDIGLPDMDGFDLLRILQRDPETRDIPVVALSANALAPEIERAYRAGFMHYLTKPIEIERLIGLFNELWSPKHAEV